MRASIPLCIPVVYIADPSCAVIPSPWSPHVHCPPTPSSCSLRPAPILLPPTPCPHPLAACALLSAPARTSAPAPVHAPALPLALRCVQAHPLTLPPAPATRSPSLHPVPGSVCPFPSFALRPRHTLSTLTLLMCFCGGRGSAPLRVIPLAFVLQSCAPHVLSRLHVCCNHTHHMITMTVRGVRMCSTTCAISEATALHTLTPRTVRPHLTISPR